MQRVTSDPTPKFSSDMNLFLTATFFLTNNTTKCLMHTCISPEDISYISSSLKLLWEAFFVWLSLLGHLVCSRRQWYELHAEHILSMQNNNKMHFFSVPLYFPTQWQKFFRCNYIQCTGQSYKNNYYFQHIF